MLSHVRLFSNGIFNDFLKELREGRKEVEGDERPDPVDL